MLARVDGDKLKKPRSTCCSISLQFDVPATYPAVSPEIEVPELEGKTAKMYRGGKICLTIHFKPLWAKNRCVLERGLAAEVKNIVC